MAEAEAEEVANLCPPGLRFRNYVPRTAGLRPACLEKPGVEEIEAMLDEKVTSLITQAQKDEALITIAPRRPNWDLKRDFERKLVHLTAKTDKAMVQLIRRQLARDAEQQAKEEAGTKEEASTGKRKREDDEQARRDEASLRLAREVGKRNLEADGMEDV